MTLKPLFQITKMNTYGRMTLAEKRVSNGIAIENERDNGARAGAKSTRINLDSF
jgi:hypothetical protein